MLSYSLIKVDSKVLKYFFVIVCNPLLNLLKLLLLLNLWEILISDKVVQYLFSIREEQIFQKVNHSVLSFSKINGVKL